MSQILNLPWGRDKISFTLPESWQLTGELEPSPPPGVPDTSVEVRRSLQTPSRASRLIDLCHKGTRVAIVIDDVSRPTPVASILPMVLDELAQGGVGREDIRLVIALGVHRPMQEQEVEQRVGVAAMQGLRWQNHACCDPDQLTSLGTTQRGTPVSINKTVAQADLVVSIGCIEPHLIASFGGGYKNLIPGVAGRETVAHNYALNCTSDTFNRVGQPIERNPMRLDLEEGCRMLKQPVFIVNAALNCAGQVVRIVSQVFG